MNRMLKAHLPICLPDLSILAMPAVATNTARGKYLAESVAICQDCHSPRGPDGQLDQTQWLKGAPIDFKPDNPMPWAVAAPDITASGKLWQSWGEAGLTKFLQTGLTPGGKHPQPPMPAYRFNARDAKAVVEYLKTLH